MRKSIEEEGRKGTVLFVDDEENVRYVAEVVLTRAGFRVILAANGREGVERFRAHCDEICVVVLDMVMPVMDGAAALRELRAHRPDVRVILSSGEDEADGPSDPNELDPAAFLPKPYRPHLLIDTIQVVVDGG